MGSWESVSRSSGFGIVKCCVLTVVCRYYALAKLYEEWRCLDRAAEYMPEAFQMTISCLGKDHPVTDFLRAERDRVTRL
jgi:hypothetical protein